MGVIFIIALHDDNIVTGKCALSNHSVLSSVVGVSTLVVCLPLKSELQPRGFYRVSWDKSISLQIYIE